MVLAVRTLLSRTRALGPETLFDGWLASADSRSDRLSRAAFLTMVFRFHRGRWNSGDVGFA